MSVHDFDFYMNYKEVMGDAHRSNKTETGAIVEEILMFCCYTCKLKFLEFHFISGPNLYE